MPHHNLFDSGIPVASSTRVELRLPYFQPKPDDRIFPSSDPGSMRTADTFRTKAGHAIGDLGTDLLIKTFRFQKPTPYQYQVGRGEHGKGARRAMVANAASLGLIDLMTGEVGGKLLGKGVSKVSGLFKKKSVSLLESGKLINSPNPIYKGENVSPGVASGRKYVENWMDSPTTANKFDPFVKKLRRDKNGS